MVNVNKNIVPGKSAEKAEEKAPMRRPRNTELNSSAKTSHLPVRDQILRKLNSSKASWEEYFTRMTDEEVAEHFQIPVEEVREDNQNLEQHNYGTVIGHYVAKPEYEEALSEYAYLDILADGTVGYTLGEGGGRAIRFYSVDLNTIKETLDESTDFDSSCGDKADVDSSLNCEAGSAKVSGTVTIYNDFVDLDNDTTERLLRSRIEKAVPGAKVDFEKVNDTDVKVNIDCPDADAEKARLAVESSDVTKSVDWESATEELDSSKDADKTTESTNLNSSTEPEGDTDGGESVSEGVDASDITITTESGNEVSMQDIKIVQNPDTNELAIFIPEDEDETIPEGFSVIGMVVPDMLDSAPAIEGGDVCPECGQDPCVCEGAEDGEELDSSKKKE